MSTLEHQILPRTSLRTLLFPLWYNQNFPNKLTINQFYSCLNDHKRIKTKQRNIPSLGPARLANQELLDSMFIETPLHKKVTFENVRNALFRCRKMFETQQEYKVRFTSKTIQRVGFFVSMDNIDETIQTTLHNVQFWNVRTLTDLNMIKDEDLIQRLENGTVVKMPHNSVPQDFESYAIIHSSLTKSYNYITEVMSTDFSFLSYPYLDDLSVHERAILPDWLISLLNIMKLYPYRESAFSLRSQIPEVTRGAFIMIKLTTKVGSRLNNYVLWSFEKKPDEFVQRLPINLTLIGDYRELIRHIADHSVNLTSDAIKYDIPNTFVRLNIGRCDLNPIDELESMRLTKWVEHFKTGVNLQLIGNKGCGKTTLIRGITAKHPDVLCIDSDEYGIFLHVLFAAYPDIIVNQDELKFIDADDFDDMQYTMALSSYLQIRNKPLDFVNGSFFEKVMCTLFTERYDSVYNPITMECIMKDFNTFFFAAISHPSFGIRRFSTDLIENLRTKGYNQYVYFAHCYGELAHLDHTEEYLTIKSNLHFSTVLGKSREDHYSSGDDSVDATVQLLLYNFYATRNTYVNETPLFLISYYLHLTEGLDGAVISQ